MQTILVVDDEVSIRESFSMILEGQYRVLLAASGEAALKTISDQKVDLTFLDIRMPGMDGIATLKRLKEIDPDLEVIMVTAVNDVKKASEAVKLGACDYAVKPFDVQHILKLAEQILRKKNILRESDLAKQKAGRNLYRLIGNSEKIKTISKIIENIKGDEAVLLLGERGTEKELIANLIHQKSARAEKKLTTLNLGPTLTISQLKNLFCGRTTGASTVDLRAKNSLFEETKQGTLFINNLESLPEEIFQIVKTKEFSRLGSTRQAATPVKVPITTRLIGGATAKLAETNKAIFEFFSATLINIPPLRERTSDIPLWLNHYLEKYNQQYGKKLKFEPLALEVLVDYDWPGNLDQLADLVERLVLICAKPLIEINDLPFEIVLKSGAEAGKDYLSLFESAYIHKVFSLNKKDKHKTAIDLGISPIVLETKL